MNDPIDDQGADWKCLGGRFAAGTTARLFVMVGLCGGYTTFSSFSLQTLNLAQDGEWLYAGLNIQGSVILCLLVVWAGHNLQPISTP